MNRGEILEGWRHARAEGRPLTGGRGGPDFIVVSNVDRFEALGARGVAGLLPLGDANAVSLQAARDRVIKAGAIPVIAGVCATDPLRLMDKFLQEVKAAGVAGVQNVPSVGLIDGGFRTNLEEAKLGYASEVEMVKLAGLLDLLTVALVFSADDARAMAKAGADAVAIHLGLGRAPSPKEGAKRIEEIAGAARSVRTEILVLAHGVTDSGALDGFQTD